jgi:aquaglyceroporin related protein
MSERVQTTASHSTGSVVPPRGEKTNRGNGGVQHIEKLETQVMVDSRDPNRWWKYKQMIREPMAEFAGVVILILFGAGVQCQVVLSTNPAVAASPKGDYLSTAFGWAIGIALGVWVSAGISGGHINPAVTLASATWRGFPWKKVPIYIFAQLMGGIVGAALVYANYFHAIDLFEGGRNVRTLKTAGLFATYAADYMTNVSAFFSEFVGTALLMLSILAFTDGKNHPVPKGLLPVALFIFFIGIASSWGMETGFAINPARDLGPRLLTSMVGYGRAVYNYRNQYWLWCPVIAPFLGAQAGALFYEAFLYDGEDGRFNQPNAARRRLLQAEGGVA